MRTDALRIANCSGFYGDRLSAAREMVEGGPIDVLTGDYLAELTMLILWKNKVRRPETGYATSFVRQMEEVLGTCLERGIKIVSNAGGLNPGGLADRLREVAKGLGLEPRIAYLRGDDLMSDLDRLADEGHELRHFETGQTLSSSGITPVTANAYLGAWGIVEALRRNADVVICPRVTDASLVVGPAAWAFSWDLSDWDCPSGAVVAGHIVECGPQATGGNFSFFPEIANPVHPGFPIAEVGPDGSCVITKHEGTSGLVSVETVTAQLLYEIRGPDYLNPDVVACFDTVELEEVGPDRVMVRGVTGRPAPEDLKVCVNYVGGWRNTATFLLTGLDIEAKARFAEASLADALGGFDQFDSTTVQLIRTDSGDAPVNAEATARLSVTVKDGDRQAVGRRFFEAATCISLSTYPGMFSERAERDASEFGVYWPSLVPAAQVAAEVVLDGDVIAVPEPPRKAYRASEPGADGTGSRANDVWGETSLVPLGAVCGARSGDKGGSANVGLWTRTEEGYHWMAAFLTCDVFRELLTESCDLPVRRFEFPNLRSLNFVVDGLLGEGVASSTRQDPQAKGLGEYVRSRLLPVPVSLLDRHWSRQEHRWNSGGGR